MSIKNIDTNNIEFEKDGNGNILVAFYDGKGTGRYKQLKSEYLNLYFEFYGTKYYLTDKQIEELNKKYNYYVL